MFETSLKKTEIIELVEFEIPQKSSYQKLANPASRYAIVGVYVAKHKTGINVAVTGAKSCVYNDKDLANVLSKNFSPSAIENVKISSSKMNSDIHASSEYRANMVKVFTKKAVEAC
jgi:carbon-monoxide dehydrogenase medium subunit